MTHLGYLADSIPWGCVGLLAGYLLGRGVRDLDVIATAVSPEESDMTERNRGFRAWLSQLGGIHVLGIVVFVLAVGTLVQGYVQNERTMRIAECSQAYANGFADALEARSDASAEAQKANDELWAEVGKLAAGASTPETREAFRTALTDYLSKRAESAKRQQENPFPPAPRDVCN